MKDNVEEFLQLLVEFYTGKQCKDNYEAFVKGFNREVEMKDLRKFFQPQDVPSTRFAIPYSLGYLPHRRKEVHQR